MPWSGIAKATAVIGGVLTLATAMSLRQAKHEWRLQQEAQRVRWTDKNRWE